MATSFLGLPVLVKLRTGSADSVQGILSGLDPASGTLTLTEGALARKAVGAMQTIKLILPPRPARSCVQGVNRLEGIRVLSRSEVAGLELLSVQRGNEVHAQNARQNLWYLRIPSLSATRNSSFRLACSLTVRRFPDLASAPVTATARAATATEVPTPLAGPFARSPRSVRTDSERPEPEAQTAKSFCGGHTCPKRTGTGVLEPLTRKE